ncbi:hypothetical protein Ocin01_08703 [Orchesella cincta]|uniref:Kazal-like domain-containing protein n=1 Tax=Orchesella cincta TaxID=48709 RepID=A0A1D2MYU0_ORCCI|nr:hypothetical protein Ocin01_08703 [Orchesella cincta]
MRSPEFELIFILTFTFFVVLTPAQDLPEIIMKLINDLLSLKERSGECSHCVGDRRPSAPGILGNRYKNDCYRKCNEGDFQMRTITELIESGKSGSKKTKTVMRTGAPAQRDQNQKAEVEPKNCDGCKKEEYKIIEGKDGILYANQCYKRCHEGKERKG